ncbi:general stress protein [Brachybacterium paraconglomeratum]|uniref:general stress protein n=1 Tax=Brachybacterium paraconglomeratum TaxID=173362 RepID=UPI003F7C5DB1
MSQSPYARQSPSASSPLTARLYDLEYPRSLGVYSTYQEVQSVVDTLADHEFPVQSTLIVGTDLKLMERVTGRRTWPKVIGQGILSGLWMGLFLGLLFMLITPGDLMIVLSSVLMGIVFFTVWSVIGYAMTGGKRDFTSMTSTIPMQYELLVEHKHADQARRILAESGAGPAVAPSPAAAPQTSPQANGPFGSPAPTQGSGQYGSPARQSGPGYGTPGPQQSGFSAQGLPGQQGVGPQHGTGQQQGFGAAPAPGSSAEQAGAQSRPHRPSFGQPAGSPQREDGPTGSAHQDGSGQQDGTSPER